MQNSGGQHYKVMTIDEGKNLLNRNASTWNHLSDCKRQQQQNQTKQKPYQNKHIAHKVNPKRYHLQHLVFYAQKFAHCAFARWLCVCVWFVCLFQSHFFFLFHSPLSRNVSFFITLTSGDCLYLYECCRYLQ